MFDCFRGRPSYWRECLAISDTALLAHPVMHRYSANISAGSKIDSLLRKCHVHP